MKFTDKLNKIEGKVYTVEEEIVVSNGKYEGFLGHDNINTNTLVVYTEKGLKGDEVTNYSLSKKEGQEWKTFIELYHPVNVFATYETSGDVVEAEDINILQDSILELNEKIKNVSLGSDIIKEIQDLKNKNVELENSINTKIAELVDSSPTTLDTLKELANALNNDPNFATTVTTELSLKANKNYVDSELDKKSDVHTHPYKDINYIPKWDEVSNKPLEFNPTSHIHSYNELEDKPFIPIVDVTKSYVDTELKKKSDVHTHPYKLDSYVPSWNELTNKPTIPTVDVNKSYVDEKLALKSDVHTHPYKSDTYVPSWNEVTGKPTNATQSNSGFMSSLDKIKLDSIQNNANNYIHPSTHQANMILFSDGETFQNKLDKGSLKGDIGPQGPTGATGPQGPTGATGAKGADGLTTSVTIGFTKYTHSNGNITLPAYPTLSSLGAEPKNANIQAHIASTHAPSDAQKNSDITKAEIEAKLTGDITTHNHNTNYYTKSQSNSEFIGWTRGSINVNTCYDAKLQMVSSGSNVPSGSNYGVVFTMPYRKLTGNSTPDFGGQIFIPNGDDSTHPNSMFYRTSLASSWNSWQEVATVNYVKTGLNKIPTKLSQLENDIGLGGLPSSFTWSMLRGY